jgi:gliding motility-associated-like protein
LEVPEGSPCKYGEEALAEACEVIVKPTNIFTPNGDGINDLLRFDLLEQFDGNKLQIFNRWGKLVFESANYQNDWNGGDLKDGTYFYVLDIDDPSGIQDIFKGTITIVR